MARDLKRVQLGLFLTSNTPKMPKDGGRQIPLCSLHPCRTGPLQGSDLLCTVPPAPKLIPSQLKPGSALLFAQWTSRLCSASSSKLAAFFLCFFSVLPTHLMHCLPLPVLCFLLYFTDPKEETIFPFLLNSESSRNAQTRSLPLHQPGALCYVNMLCGAQYITCKQAQQTSLPKPSQKSKQLEQ